MRLVLQFAAMIGGKKITSLGSIEESRGNAVQSRNQRLAALRATHLLPIFERVGRRFPDRFEQAQTQKVAAIPRKRAQPPETIFLERDEVEGTLAALPEDGRYPLRDGALLVFLYSTGSLGAGSSGPLRK